MKPCTNCGKPTEDYVNYCDWDCHVEHAKKEGGRVHCPNGLPVRCIRHDGLMLECEHGDHPDYKFPVVAQRDDGSEQDVHALIYTDGTVALTLYECCYVLWSLRDGRFLSGPQWLGKDWRLNLVSITQINELAPKGKGET